MRTVSPHNTEEGLYIGERPRVPWSHIIKMENRILQRNDEVQYLIIYTLWWLGKVSNASFFTCIYSLKVTPKIFPPMFIETRMFSYRCRRLFETESPFEVSS